MATVTKLTLADRVFEACVDDLAEAVKLVEGTLGWRRVSGPSS